jgi:hypothetical protein
MAEDRLGLLLEVNNLVCLDGSLGLSDWALAHPVEINVA